MTLGRTLPPLPTHCSTIFAQEPVTFEQWQIALKGVQALYLKRNYKQCASRCTKLLVEASFNIHPIHRTFLLFYSALCKEILARATHNLSSNKLALLHQAQDLYMQASDSLPIPQTNSEEGNDNSVSERSKDGADGKFEPSSASNSISILSPALTDASSAPSTDLGDNSESDREVANDYASDFEDELSLHPDAFAFQAAPLKSVLCPAPLRIRKAVHFDKSPEKTRRPTDRALPRPPTLALIQPLSLPRHNPSKSSSMSSFLLNRSLSRYHSGLESFRPHIATHLVAVEALIETAHTVQESRRRSLDNSLRNSKRLASFWSFKPQDGDSMSHEKERIERLRNNGWKLGQNPGLGRWKGSQYYEELSEKALKELGD